MPKSHSHYQDFRDLCEDGRIVLYKRADHQNPKWTVRLKIPGTEGFVVKSTKTTDDYEARRFAEDLYYKLEGRARRGEPINAPSFKRVFAEWSETQNLDRHVRTKKYVNGNVRRVEIWLLQYFGEKPIDAINENTLGDYAEWRYAQDRKPAVSTLKNERTALNQMLKFAKRKGYVRAIPEFRIKSAKQTARPDLPESEWIRLTRSFDSYLARARDKRRRRERFYLKQYILILANTGIRIGEARRIQWRDISHTRTLTSDIRIVLTVRGKTGERDDCNIAYVLVTGRLTHQVMFLIRQGSKSPLLLGQPSRVSLNINHRHRTAKLKLRNQIKQKSHCRSSTLDKGIVLAPQVEIEMSVSGNASKIKAPFRRRSEATTPTGSVRCFAGIRQSDVLSTALQRI